MEGREEETEQGSGEERRKDGKMGGWTEGWVMDG